MVDLKHGLPNIRISRWRVITGWWWLEPWNFLTFHILGMSSSQLTFIFFRGVETTNQYNYITYNTYIYIYVSRITEYPRERKKLKVQHQHTSPKFIEDIWQCLTMKQETPEPPDLQGCKSPGEADGFAGQQLGAGSTSTWRWGAAGSDLQVTESGADFSWESGEEIDGICHSISSRCWFDAEFSWGQKL